MTSSSSIGKLVHVRNRDWVVLPESNLEDGFLVLSPLDGNSNVQILIDEELEVVETASFDLPSLDDLDSDDGEISCIGNLAQARLLRDAVRLSFRNAAGPFRSLSRIGIEPRPYQLVPLMMALKQETIRLLIADDVGIGKTVEALLIARELFDRGEIDGFSVLCPPHLAEQWKDAMVEQFGFEDTTLVLASTAKKLEKDLIDGDDSIFKRNPITVVSLDFIKQESRRNSFIRTCRKLIIVDEAHGCTEREERGGQKQVRHQLLKAIAENPEQHVVLVTATPHSGHQDAFASLIGLLDTDFKEIASSVSPSQQDRQRIAKHLVQRRRPDIKRDFKDMGTTFPTRLETSVEYEWSGNMLKLFKDIVEWCKSRIETAGSKNTARVRHWSMLGLMRAMSSSPAAAIAGLQNRSSGLGEELDTTENIESSLFDIETEGGIRDEVISTEQLEGTSGDREILESFIQRFESIFSEKDTKLDSLCEIIEEQFARSQQEGEEEFHPIIFCRFVPTVDYLTTKLSERLKNVHVEGITGRIAPEERLRRVEVLGESEQRILICTDCLAEGVNLQQYFNSVIHYDLSWSPTNHEQREGRVDRFGQQCENVRAMSIIGSNNIIDGIVSNIIIEKQKTIRSQLQISVPAPNAVAAIQAAVDAGFLAEMSTTVQTNLSDFFEDAEQRLERQEREWLDAADRELKRRSIFAQGTIKVEEVSEEINEIRDALGDPEMVADFLESAISAYGATPNREEMHLTFTTEPMDDEIQPIHEWKEQEKLAIVDDVSPVPRGFRRIVRTSPVVERIARHVMGTSLDPISKGRGRRMSVTRTNDVTERTIILLARARFSLKSVLGGKETTNLVEDLITIAFTGDIADPNWLDKGETKQLWDISPSGSMPPEQARMLLKPILKGIKEGVLNAPLIEKARILEEEIITSHQRVRTVTKEKGKLSINTHQPMDILSISILLPQGGD
jgi:superfamily II DNA or RNA helicase